MLSANRILPFAEQLPHAVLALFVAQTEFNVCLLFWSCLYSVMTPLKAN